MTLAALVLLLCAALPAARADTATAARAASAVPLWAPVTVPGGGSWTVRDVATFGKTGIALAGDGHVAVSKDGGKTWRSVVPGGNAGATYVAVAFVSSGRGVVASGGLLLVTADSVVTRAPPGYSGSRPTVVINAVAFRDTRAVAVGDAGEIFASDDSGATWQDEVSPTTASLTSVALAADGTAVAGSAGGEILVRTAGWAVAGTTADPITSVAVAPTSAFGDGKAGPLRRDGAWRAGQRRRSHVRCRCPASPTLASGAWPQVAWAGLPESARLVAGPQEAGFFGRATATWFPTATGLNTLGAAAAPGGQSVAYLLDDDGRLLRTFGAGRDPAPLTLSKRRVVTGGATRLSARVSIAAPGPWCCARACPAIPGPECVASPGPPLTGGAISASGSARRSLTTTSSSSPTGRPRSRSRRPYRSPPCPRSSPRGRPTPCVMERSSGSPGPSRPSSARSAWNSSPTAEVAGAR